MTDIFRPLTYTSATFIFIFSIPNHATFLGLPKGKKVKFKRKRKKENEKVVYSVQRVGRFEIPKMSGLGVIVEDNLLISAISQKGKPYIRVFEGVTEYCHKVVGKENEFKGFFTEYKEVEVEKNNNGYKSIETIEVENEYKIWYKYAD